jgi:hypothetical protein
MSKKQTYDQVGRVALDESVSQEERLLAWGWLRQRGLLNPATVDIKTEYSGLADERILASLMGPDCLLVTRDRPFHNVALKWGFRSLWVCGKDISPYPLAGIQPLQLTRNTSEDLEAGMVFHPPAVALRPHLMPTDEKELKTLTQRRRRIRNHFGGFHNLAELAVTVSSLPTSRGVLLGIRLRVVANNGMKALDASETYLMERCDRQFGPSAALCQSLVIPIQLLLCSLKTTIFHDSPKATVETPYLQGFERLRDCYPALSFQLCTKGFQMERLRRKLVDLSRGESNEVRVSRLSEYLGRLDSQCG